MNQMMTPQRTRKALRAVIASGFLVALGTALVSFALPLASLDMRISGSWLGTGFAGFFFARMAAGPLGGRWADKASARVPLLVGATLGMFAPLGYLIAPSLGALYLIQFILGIVSGLVRPVALAVLGGNAPDENQSKWFNAHVLVFNLAVVLGPLLGGALYWNRSMEPVLVGLALCMTLAHLIVFAGVPSSIRSRRLSIPEGKKAERASLVALLVALWGRTFGIGVFIAFYPVLLAIKLGMQGITVGLLFALPGLVTCLGLPIGPWVRRNRKGDPVVWGLLSSAAGMILAGFSFEVWHFAVSGLIMGIGTALSIAESMRLASGMSRQQGRVFGTTHLVTGLGFVLGPMFGGLVVQSVGDAGAAFVLAGLLGWFCLLPWDRYEGWSWNRERPVGKWLFSKTIPAVILLVAMVGSLQFFLDQGKGEEGDLFRYTDIAMGTVVNLTLETDSRKAADDASRKVFAYMRNVQADLDFRDPNGSIARINRGAGRYFVKPTKRAYDVLKRAVAFSQKTEGVFDPTIGALTSSPLYYVLDDSIAHSKKNLVDYRLVEFRDGDVRLAKPGMALDLGGIAKGTIIDGAVRLLRKQGIKAGIVEAGGDFYCFGERTWKIGIRHPRMEEVYAAVAVREKGVCGSGDYQQFVEIEKNGAKELRHHIINPSDMESAGESAGVTVIADSAEEADALATALFIMGPASGAAFVKETFPNAAAMWFTPDLKVSATENFPKE